jgi:hypothetical protein
VWRKEYENIQLYPGKTAKYPLQTSKISTQQQSFKDQSSKN